MDVNASVGIYFDEYAMIFLYGALKTKFERMVKQIDKVHAKNRKLPNGGPTLLLVITKSIISLQ